MTSATPLRRTLLVTLACVALFAPAAFARPVDLRAEAPTSSLSGTKGTVFEHVFDPYPEPTSRRDAALAQERSYSNTVKPTRLVATWPTTTGSPRCPSRSPSSVRWSSGSARGAACIACTPAATAPGWPPEPQPGREGPPRRALVMRVGNPRVGGSSPSAGMGKCLYNVTSPRRRVAALPILRSASRDGKRALAGASGRAKSRFV
jgi:hypothetical protein